MVAAGTPSLSTADTSYPEADKLLSLEKALRKALSDPAAFDMKLATFERAVTTQRSFEQFNGQGISLASLESALANVKHLVMFPVRPPLICLDYPESRCTTEFLQVPDDLENVVESVSDVEDTNDEACRFLKLKSGTIRVMKVIWPAYNGRW